MQYNLILNSSGGVIDDCMVYCFSDKFICVVNASNKDKVFTWLNENKQVEVELSDKSQELALISLQGPKSAEIIAKVIGSKVHELNYMYFFKTEIKGKVLLVSRSGYTGEDGFEVYVTWDEAGFWWDKFLAAGDTEITPCGLGARDILRIEAGYPLYGHEINEAINPYEATLTWALKLNKEFIGKENLAASQHNGLKRKRVGLIMQERAVPRQGYSLYFKDKVVGEVTSGTYSPNLEQFIAMAYLDKHYTEVDSEVKIKIRDKFYQTKVVKFPFIRSKTKKLASKGA